MNNFIGSVTNMNNFNRSVANMNNFTKVSSEHEQLHPDQ